MTGRRTSPLATKWAWISPEANVRTALVLSALVVASAFAWVFVGAARAGTEFLILLTGVVGLYVFVGNTGVVSFGHVAFMAVGGYVSAIVTLPPSVKEYRLDDLPAALLQLQLGVPAGILLGAAAAALVAAMFGLLVWRVSGFAASISTLALLLIGFNVASGWEGVTGGRGAVPSVPRWSSFFVALGYALVVIWIAWLYQRSRQGRLVRAAREDEAAARSLGVHVEFGRWLSLVLSAAITGLAGALFVHFVGSVSPDFFYLAMMFNLLAMLVVGGMLSLSGAVVGTIVIRAARRFLEPLDSGFSLGFLTFEGRPGLRLVAVGVVLLVILARRAEGLVGNSEFVFGRPQVTRRSR